MRQDAPEIIRRVQNGQQIDITVSGRLAAAGGKPRARVMDLLIAATAHAHSARLYTRNAADLVEVADLIDVVPV